MAGALDEAKIIDYFRNKSVLITGATGFLGKIMVEKILRVQPDVKRIYLPVRAADAAAARRRVETEVVGKELFGVLRERHGAGFDAFVADKVVGLAGDVMREPMSLVAYDASSDEDEAGDPPAAAAASAPAPAPPPRPAPTVGPQPRPPSPSPSVRAAPRPSAPPPAPSQNVSLPAPSFDLPDIADLFDSPSLPNRGSAGMVGSSSRKRESNGSAIQDPRSKFPRAQSAQSRGARNAAASTLVPPQLSGRSNVVTEDMGKLFVARRKD